MNDMRQRLDIWSYGQATWGRENNVFVIVIIGYHGSSMCIKLNVFVEKMIVWIEEVASAHMRANGSRCQNELRNTMT